MWNAFRSSDDLYLLESIKYPMSHKACRNDIHVKRRKQCIDMLRRSFGGSANNRAVVMLIG